MGKIGDLWVKLGVKSDGAETGMKRFSQSIKDTVSKFRKLESAGGKVQAVLGTLKTVGLGMASAIGAAVVKVAGDVINHSERLQRKFKSTTAGMSAAWETFIDSVSKFNWEHLGQRIRNAFRGARDLADIMSGRSSVELANKIDSAANASQLESYKTTASDTSLSMAEREAASQAATKILERQKARIATQVTRELEQALRNLNTQNGTNYTVDQLRTALIARGEMPNAFSVSARDRNVPEAIMMAAKSRAAGFDLGAFADATRNNSEELDALGNLLVESAEIQKDYDDKIKGFADALKKTDKQKVTTTKTVEDTAFLKAQESVARWLRSNTDNDYEKMLKEAGASARAEAESWEMYVDAVEEALDVTKEIGDELDDIGESIAESLTEGMLQQIYKMEDAAESLAGALQSGAISALDELAELLGTGVFSGADLIRSFLSPIADACVKAGMMILATGTAVEAFKKALTSLNGPAAIAAGAALVAVGTAAKAGLAALGSGSGGSYSSYSSGNGSGAAAGNVYNGEMTIYVKGTLKGSDIAISGQKAINQWGR